MLHLPGRATYNLDHSHEWYLSISTKSEHTGHDAKLRTHRQISFRFHCETILRLVSSQAFLYLI